MLSGRIVSFDYDGNNRPLTLTGVPHGKGTPTKYLSSIAYCPHGGVQSLQTGNYLSRSYSYNSRLQPTGIMEGTSVGSTCAAASASTGVTSLLDMQASWTTTGSTNNNGVLRGHVVNTGSQTGASSALSVSQAFTYDRVNRIMAFTDNGSGSALERDFSHAGTGDNGQAGNVYVNPSSTLPSLSLNAAADATAFNALTNRLSSSDTTSGQTAAYDNNGNLTSVGVGSAVTYSFTCDAENRQTSMAFCGAQSQYVYDGEGRRVQTINPGGVATTFVYDTFGQMVADYGAPSTTSRCQTCYLSVDHPGSSRLVTDQNGNAVSRHDFAPFGDELTAGLATRCSAAGCRLLITSHYVRAGPPFGARLPCCRRRS